MARRPATPNLPPDDLVERIVDIDVATEMEGSFLEYAYSVIYSRALPDARDGLKPVQRRILFQMSDMGLRPDRPYVKSARVVGEVMGKLHPHGDSAIYDAMVRLAQPFSLRLPLVDGHGNFGSLDDGPAAPRYTEARLAPAAMAMTTDLDEDVVDFVPNYDNKLQQPDVLPAAIPNLLVNGAAGIAVGMATNMAPHNLVEVVAAARHLVMHPDATLDDLVRFVPGPDLPTGGKIVGLDGVRDAYRTGRGAFRTRATARVENVTARRKGIVITELPYMVGPEKVIEKIKEGVQSKKLSGIADAVDLTDRAHGLRLVIEVKSGFDPDAVLEQLYRATPLEDSFSINNVALVEGQPRTLGLRELLVVWVDHRLSVVRRRSQFRLDKRLERLHLVEGLLIAILDIDEVIQVIRTSDDAEAARARLRSVFDLSEPQAEYILELRLRRLTKFSRLELEREKEQLEAEIDELRAILADDLRLRTLVSDEMAQVAATYGTPRRTILLESAGGSAVTGAAAAKGSSRAPAVALEIADTPCWALLSGTGLLARTATDEPLERTPDTRRAKHDVLASVIATTTRAEIGAVTSRGRLVRVPMLDLPALPPTNGAPSLGGGVPLSEVVALDPGERVVALASLAPDAPTLALATAQGVVKRVTAGDVPNNRDAWEVIGLKDGDEVVGASQVTDDDELVLVSSDSSLLHFGATQVRPQGRAAGGMAGIKLAAGQRVVAFAGLSAAQATDAVVVTVSGSSSALPGTQAGSAKVSPFEVFPGKGRATGGVRSHRFLKGEDALILAWVGPAPAWACGSAGQPVDLPAPDPRRDMSGTALHAPLHAIG
ncbi:MAG: DNA topoisomerase IV subunit A [Cellulomonas sp.]|uniref:DNA topoisomerase (ATP-hydrolyzing) n=1 Tax=Cellulomonas gelida TaxID=1712 RepID=A0A4Y3KMV7_9CELL|nr:MULTISPECIES: DNA topoisomerase IV subunit A [Cellulomonas]KMM46329.1 DNA topoisomerase IV subunit A [Cellulomonas sp. A375-1]MCR6647651.1 DNA topoisomerase IV subunit A [Cellulomonas sp.]MCR6703643.1 DNA topoisomerase IV subunit A [Cellulomonas sp.]GEA85213.1 DNA topoisomerase (ATP-hydrolyzing) [Cellulomonas gelida]GGL39437.1 DNA topoisomerase (ATP-hydrolyzing) [Cellulomonas gelida]